MNRVNGRICLLSKSFVFKAKKRVKSKHNAGTTGENDSTIRDSTIMATSKYLNHTQLKNETESLSLLNSRVRRSGLQNAKNTKILERLVEEESSFGVTLDEIEEENQMYLSDKKRQKAMNSLYRPSSRENANAYELQEHTFENELQVKLQRLESSM
jgi:hypothetical protein